MLRQGAILCHETLVSAAKAAMMRVSQGATFSLRPVQPLIPAVQLLTIPLNEHPRHISRRGAGRHRYYSSSVASSSTARSSFKEDYDEWYSHGRVGSITRQPTDDEMYFSGTDPEKRGLLLDEIRQEEANKSSSQEDFQIQPKEEMIFDSHLNESILEVQAATYENELDDEAYFAIADDDHDVIDDFDVGIVSEYDDFLDDS
jgi:hypothetical protein